MKTTFLSALAVFAGLTGQASAQSAGTDWSGFYAGGGFATGVSNLSVAELSAVGPTNGELGESDLDQFFVFAGYTWDFGTFTLGGELQFFDSSPSGLAGVATFSSQICPFGPSCADASVFSTIDPTFRLRAIGGYEVGDNTLVMGALGIARADVTYNGIVVTATSAGGGRSQSFRPSPPIATESGSIDGISLGFGVEHRVADGFSIRAFVNHDIYNSFTVANPATATQTNGGNSATATVTDFIDYTTTTLEVGIVFRF
ncbi:MAG: outer membrane beta-barrel protein [Roseicyclus sp.]|nr:outer membrane beta-barrel protein [Roseicyclus sp.]